jgi:hypothetical protein
VRAILPKRYEVKTEGDAFMIAFTSPSDAVLFGTELQTDLIDYPWPSWLIEDSDVQDLVGTFYLANNNKTTDGAPATTDTIPIAPELFALGLAPAEAGDATTGDDGGESKAVKGTSPEEERATRSEKPEGWGVGMQPPGAALLKRGSLRANKEDLGVLAKNVCAFSLREFAYTAHLRVSLLFFFSLHFSVAICHGASYLLATPI